VDAGRGASRALAQLSTFAGKSALVTGGGSGIGAECARLLSARGAQVVVADLRLAAAEEIAGELGADAVAFEADVRDPDACTAMVAAAIDAFGRLDVAVNSAGISSPEQAPVAEIAVDNWRAVLATNLDGVFYSLRAEIPAMLESGGGSIVNIASAVGIVGLPNSAAYVASKHAVVGLTRGAALEYSSHGVRINAVGPGVVATPMTEARGGQRLALHPIGRLGRTIEVAELVAFLASDASGFCTGGFYPVDGAWTAQ
jgi:NAD(P)-dependent dehydrogenase (short-subunit alcohol dehydrogenase family)